MKKIVVSILILMVLAMPTFGDEDTPAEWAQEDIEALKGYPAFETVVFEGFGDAITRGDFIVIAVKIFETLEGQEINIDPSIVFKDTTDTYALKGASVGITSGMGDQTFGSDVLLTREQLATFMVRVLQLHEASLLPATPLKFSDDLSISSWAKEGVYIARNNLIIDGVDGQRFEPKGQASLEMALVMAQRILSRFYVEPPLVLPVEDDPLEVYYGLIDDTSIGLIHESMALWQWQQKDAAYLEGGVDRRVLEGEIKTLEAALLTEESKRIDINNMYFYPSSLVYRLEIIDQGIVSRKNYIEGRETYANSLEDSRLTRAQYLDFQLHNDLIRGQDKLLLAVIDAFPYHMFKGTKVIMLPFVSESGGFYASGDGICVYSGSRLVNSTFYHEIGHMWSYRFLNNEFSDYLKVRGKTEDDVDHTYRRSAIENFAEDFKFSMAPTSVHDASMSFGMPDQATALKIKNYIEETMAKYPQKNTSYEGYYIYQYPLKIRGQ